jgi:hypothetical protein
MPIPNDYREICEMLLTATHEKRVTWTEERGTIAVQLPQFNLEIWSGSDDQTQKEFVGLGLRDPKDKQLVDNWYVEEGDEDFDALLELWRSARRQARGVPDKLEQVRQFLRHGGEVGKGRRSS